MNSELEVLKKIWQSGGKTYIKLISNQTGLSLDYARYLCNCLFKKDQLKPIKGKRDCYGITPKGKRELRLRGIAEEKVPRKVRNLEKLIYYLPAKKLKVSLPKSNFQKVGTKCLEDNLIEAKEKKLNLGKKIEKAVSFLRNF